MKTVIDDYMVECTVEEFIKIIEWKRSTLNIEETANELVNSVVRIGRGVHNTTKPKYVRVQRKGESAVICRSIREAQKFAGIDFSSFNLARHLREHRSIEVDGIVFTIVERTPKNEQTRPKKSRKIKMKYMLIYPDGDNRLINLMNFCKEHNLPYEHIRKNTTYNPYQYGDFVFKKVN